MYTRFLRQEIAPACGCTEPAAIALAAALAASTLAAKPDSVEVRVSGAVFKNARGVSIPGTERLGVAAAAAIGAMGGDAALGLEVLRTISETDRDAAHRLLDEGRVCASLLETEELLAIEVTCRHEGENACAVIEGGHTRVVALRHNGRDVLESEAEEMVEALPDPPLSIDDILAYVHAVPDTELAFLREAADVNIALAEEGMRRGYGLQVGKTLGLRTQDDPFSYAVALAASAADARMAGCGLSAMSVGGSGNQGITAMLPVVGYAQAVGETEPRLLRAMAVSMLVTLHVKRAIGTLSALCGCAIASSVGVACAVAYLLEGSAASVRHAAQNTIADITGMLCDGAKPGCALKIATCASGALQCAYLAAQGIGATVRDGIVAEDVEQSIASLARIGNQGMTSMHDVLYAIMCE